MLTKKLINLVGFWCYSMAIALALCFFRQSQEYHVSLMPFQACKIHGAPAATGNILRISVGL